MSYESAVAESWLQQTLGNDATLATLGGWTAGTTARVYQDVAPQNNDGEVAVAYPFIVYQMQSPGADLIVVGAIRVWSDMTYLVKVINETRSYAGNLQAIAERVDVLLHAKFATVAGSVATGHMVECVRRAPFKMAEMTDGRHYRHLGATWTIKAQGQ